MIRGAKPLSQQMRSKAVKAVKVPDYLSFFDDQPDPGETFTAFTALDRKPENEPGNRMDKGPNSTFTAFTAFTAPVQAKAAITAALFEPSGPGYIVLESQEFGRMVWTSRDTTLVPDQFTTLPRYSWPELEGILDSGISRESLAELHRIKAALPGIVKNVSIEHSCLDCSAPVSPADFFCGPCFEKRQAVTIEDRARIWEARRQRTIARLKNQPCSECGAVKWQVNARGDSWCLACRGAV